MDSVDLQGKTVIVTGCNTGIGKETAKQIAGRGAKVIMACRSVERTEPARQEIISQTNNTQVKFMQLDLASLKSVREFADEFNKNESRLDILINNAGMWPLEKQFTEDGHELTFGVNHLGHFLLTNLLLNKLKASAPSRIVVLSSIAHERSPIEFDNLESEKSLSKNYPRSKTANILFTVHLAKLLKDTGVTVYAVHPGIIKTEIIRNMPCYGCCCLTCMMTCVFRCILCRKIKTLEEGAETTLYCALEPSIAEHSGRYYSDSRETPASHHATDPEIAQRLWEISLEKVGLK